MANLLRGDVGNIGVSTDGKNWTAIALQDSSSVVAKIAFGNSIFVAVTSGGTCYTSTNGTSWTRYPTPFGGSNIYGIAYGNGKFVAIGYYGNVSTTIDGKTWTTKSDNIAPNSYYMNRIAYVDNQFAAFGDTGYIATSIDGLTWTEPYRVTNELGSTVKAYISAMIKVQ